MGCKNNEFICADPEQYPYEAVNNAFIKDPDKFGELFGVDTIEKNTTIGQRIDAPGETSLCESREEVIYPKMGLNSEDKWRVIVNNGNYKQGIRIETCLQYAFKFNRLIL